MNSTWTRNTDGSYTLNGWTIRRVNYKGTGQSKPFTHVGTKAHSAWIVFDPQGFDRTGSDSLSGAKVNAAAQMARLAGI